MTPKQFLSLTFLTFLISGCSILGGGTKPVEIISKPVERNIMQPALPRAIEMTSPKFYVVSEAKIVNPCVATIPFEPKKYKEDGTERFKRPKFCEPSERENPDWPEGYTYLDKFMDDMKDQNGGDIVFIATTVGDYEVMSANMQEIKRYIKQMGEVIVYYRTVTDADKDKPEGGKKDE